MPVTESLSPAGVDFFEVHRLRLREVGAPQVSPEEEAVGDRVWDKAVRANPSLFDGPVVACAGLEWEGPHSLVLSWARVTYRHYALRRVPGCVSWLPSLFVSVVQATDDGRVLVARMSSSTAAPGRWQLPGGSVEPPGEGGVLDAGGVRGNAARELAEEIGVEVPPERLPLWAVTRGENRSIGLVHTAPALPGAVLRRCFAGVTAADRARGVVSELDRIALIGSVAELGELDGPHADYLEPIVRRFLEGWGPGGKRTV
nr:NUDIX domain-containing protein [Streptomyces hoynatensis]